MGHPEDYTWGGRFEFDFVYVQLEVSMERQMLVPGNNWVWAYGPWKHVTKAWMVQEAMEVKEAK